MVGTAEKVPVAVTLIARGPAGHGSVPLRTNAVVHLAQAVAKVAAWQPPMRLNDTTRTYFERLAGISPPEQAARYRGIVDPQKTAAIQEYFATEEPAHNSMLRTSISPNIIQGGYRANVIPSEAQVRLDVRALPDENMETLLAQMKQVIGDPTVEIVTTPGARKARHAVSGQQRSLSGDRASDQKALWRVTVPSMSTGATDKAQLRAKGIPSYGIGPATDEEDGPLGFGAHSDQERILESELHRFVRMHWDAVTALAGSKN